MSVLESFQACGRTLWVVMEGEESPRLLQMPLVQRLDRLDRLLQNLEEKQGLSAIHNSTATDSVQHERGEQQCKLKPLASVLGEVPSKGSLMERVAMLENRLLQLCVEIGGGEKLNSGRISLPESSREAVSDASSVKNGQGMLEETGEEVKSPGMPKGPKKRSRLRANLMRGIMRRL